MGHVDLDPGGNLDQVIEATALCCGLGKRGDADDGMAQDWHTFGKGRIYLNPDWGERPPKEDPSPCWYPLSQWMRKVVEEYESGADILFVGPMSSGARWFHESVGKHAAVFCIHQGRIKFRLPEQEVAPLNPGRDNLSALWSRDESMIERFRRTFDLLGMVIG